MRDGTTKLLAAGHNFQQILEGSKDLVTSNARMLAYMTELQRCKTSEVLSRLDLKNKSSSGKKKMNPCKGKLALSGIRIPLQWKEADHFKKNPGEGEKQFALFCIARVGTEVQDTALLDAVNPSLTDVCFDDVLTFDDIDPNFHLELELYSVEAGAAVVAESFPSRKTRFRSDSWISRTSKVKEDKATTEKHYSTADIGVNFVKKAHATLTLEDVHDNIKTHDLVEDKAVKCASLPLFGYFCCRLAVQPSFSMADDVNRSHICLLSKLEVMDSFPTLLTCSIMPRSLELREDRSSSDTDQSDANEMATYSIPLTVNSEVIGVSNSTSEHPLRFTITSKESNGTPYLQHTFSAESDEARDTWLAVIEQRIFDIGAWGYAGQTHISMPELASSYPSSMCRTTSLYDDTSINRTPVKVADPVDKVARKFIPWTQESAIGQLSHPRSCSNIQQKTQHEQRDTSAHRDPRELIVSRETTL
ncbi:PREDICTED: rhotekin-2-like [Priapulus caudatus]|uniref:Rhotekin-2-like n=1 Tax=Priapulus caudatus TaxID=37621 RepID=A0ABM1F9E2_PRICU|nr:PREDICTED: rhotekin-2-like [Priapulus caudatus]